MKIDVGYTEGDVTVDQVDVEGDQQAKLFRDGLVGASRRPAIAEVTFARGGHDLRGPHGHRQWGKISGESRLLLDLFEAIACEGTGWVDLQRQVQRVAGVVLLPAQQFLLGAVGELLYHLKAGDFETDADRAVVGRKAIGLGIGAESGFPAARTFGDLALLIELGGASGVGLRRCGGLRDWSLGGRGRGLAEEGRCGQQA